MSQEHPENPTRKTKVFGLAETVEKFFPPTIESLVIGGMHLHNSPMALVREIIRQQKKIKRLITSPASSINIDMLIGAGLVEELVVVYLGFEHLGLAPAFRRFTREGRLKVYEIDELTLILGMRAAAAGQPFAALSGSLALSDVAKASPEFYKPLTDPFTGQTVLATPPIKPQIAIIVAQQADEYGNAIFKGSSFTDRDMMLAAGSVVLQTEEVISNEVLTRNPMLVTVPGFKIDAVVASRFGCHPTSSHRYYNFDAEHLKEYLSLAATAEGFEEYLKKYVYDVSEDEYLKLTRIAS